MKTYPIFKVKAKNALTLMSPYGDFIDVKKGDIGTFQARTDTGAGITNPLHPEPVIIDAIFKQDKSISFKPKYYLPNGNIKPMLSQEFDLIVDKQNSVGKAVYSNIEGDEATEKIVVTKEVMKVAPIKYIKQRDYILTLVAIGALSGFSKAKLSGKSTTTIAITTVMYAGISALLGLGLATVINKQI